MKKNLDFMAYLDDKLIEKGDEEMKNGKSVWMKWGAMAACFAVIAITAVTLAPKMFNREPPVITDAPLSSSTEPTPVTTAPTPVTTEPPQTVIDVDPPAPPAAKSFSLTSFTVNEIVNVVTPAQRWRDPNEYDKLTWDKDAFAAYFGSDLMPAYLPSGTTPSAFNGTASVVADKNGNVVEDTARLNFYHAYDEFGYPKMTEDVAAKKGMTITVSKLGMVGDCVYATPDADIVSTEIDGTAITWGRRAVPYGPYDPVTREPAGSYDMFVASFSRDGIDYQIVSEQLPFDEIVKVVISIITGAADIEIR